MFNLSQLDNIIALSMCEYEESGRFTDVTCYGNVEKLKQELYKYNDDNDRCYYGYLNYVKFRNAKDGCYFVDTI